MVTRCCEEEEWGILSNGYRVSVWDDGKVPNMDGGDCHTRCEYKFFLILLKYS